MIEYHLVKPGSIFSLGGVLTMLRSAHPQDPQTYDLYPTLFIHWYISNVKSKDMSTIYPIPYRKKNPFECGMNIVGMNIVGKIISTYGLNICPKAR